MLIRGPLEDISVYMNNVGSMYDLISQCCNEHNCYVT